MIILLFGIARDKLRQHGQREGSDAVKGEQLKRESIEEVHKSFSVDCVYEEFFPSIAYNRSDVPKQEVHNIA